MKRFTVLAFILIGCGSDAQFTPGRCDDTKRNGNETDIDCGGGDCQPCAVGAACFLPSDCTSNTCTSHTCMSPPQQCTNGVRDATETDLDCGGGTCPACANGKACQLGGDCQSNFCNAHACAAPPQQCTDTMKDGNETDIDCGGGTCAPCSNHKACQSPSDCQSNNCVALVCTAPPQQCTDTMKDGNETDIDCGGGTCTPCGNGKACQRASDCQSNTCTGLTCAAPPAQCANSMKDANESDVDCGGVCPACINGRSCVQSTDCQSGSCNAGTCGPPPAGCNDGQKNGTETDVDCGGSCPRCVNGKMCGNAGDCVGGICASGVCSAPPPQCTDNMRDGTETDIDCGGASCSTCANGKLCDLPSDCTSGLCLFVCQAPQPTCVNGTKDGTETDVDCGGFSCASCATGKACMRGSDCLSGLCTANVCTAAPADCHNGVRDGAETDVDCGGGTCPGCGTDKMCVMSSDCFFNFCSGMHCVPPG
jgi:hypothetical protein